MIIIYIEYRASYKLSSAIADTLAVIKNFLGAFKMVSLVKELLIREDIYRIGVDSSYIISFRFDGNTEANSYVSACSTI